MMKKQLLSTTFALMALTISADEGMWMLTDLKAQNEACYDGPWITNPH